MTIAIAIPELWDKVILPNLYASSVMASLVSIDYQSKMRSEGGDTIKMPSITDIVIKDYTGADIEVDDPDGTNQELVISQKKYFGVKILDVIKAQSNLKLMKEYQKSAREQTRLVVDTYLLGSQADVAAANTIGTVGVPIALDSSNIYDYLVDLNVLLKDANAIKPGETPWLVLPPAKIALLRKCDDFIHATSLGDKILRTGQIGRVADFEIYESTNVSAIAGKYHLLAGVRSAIQFVMQLKETDLCKLEKNFGSLYKGLMLYGRKTTNNLKLAKIIST